MCFTVVEKINGKGPIGKRRPAKVLARWKTLRRRSTRGWSTEIEVFGHYLGFSQTGKWLKAQPYSHPDTGDRDPNSGWHVYLTRGDARRCQRRLPASYRLEVVKVEVAGLLARGHGDGYGNHGVEVETYNWIRVPQKRNRKGRR